MVSLYLTITIVVLMIAYAGFDNTLKLFGFVDLQFRYLLIKIKLEVMRRRMKKQLDIDRKELLKRIQKDAKVD